MKYCRCTIVAVFANLYAIGCATPRGALTGDTDTMFGQRRVVVEVTVLNVERVEHVDLVFGQRVERTAELRVDRVVKGVESGTTLLLKLHPTVTQRERAQFPPVGIRPGQQLVIGYQESSRGNALDPIFGPLDYPGESKGEVHSP